MANLDNFDANTVDPSAAFDPLPSGRYVAAIVESEMKPTKSGNGNYLELVFAILDGQYKGRKVWARLNLYNPNQQAVQIARAELSAICHATGVMKLNDSIELHNLPLCIKVVCRKREDTGEISNEIKGYEKKEAAFQPGASPTTPPAAQSTNDTAPWGR